jgi:hypothetical protein
MIQVQRRSSTPTVLPNSTMPILSGVGPHQKVILAHITNPPSPGTTTQQISMTPGSPSVVSGNSMQMNTGGQTVVPLIRPIQPGSPIIMRPAGQNQQFVVRILLPFHLNYC